MYKGRTNPIIDEIQYKGKKHFVYSKAVHYWIISQIRTKKGMFSVLVTELELSEKQKAEQNELIKNRNKNF
jgi:hypothetical protein